MVHQIQAEALGQDVLALPVEAFYNYNSGSKQWLQSHFFEVL